jgi:hypothetical protein
LASIVSMRRRKQTRYCFMVHPNILGCPHQEFVTPTSFIYEADVAIQPFTFRAPPELFKFSLCLQVKTSVICHVFFAFDVRL